MGYPPMKLGDEFRFTKHKGDTLETVIDEDITFIRWALGKDIIKLDNEAFEAYQPAIEEYEIDHPPKE